MLSKFVQNIPSYLTIYNKFLESLVKIVSKSFLKINIKYSRLLSNLRRISWNSSQNIPTICPKIFFNILQNFINLFSLKLNEISFRIF